MRASVVLCCYNGADFIAEQVRTILASMRRCDELIISDDGSEDATVAIIKDLATEDDRITLINGPRRGVIANFGHVLARASGDVVFLADQDDIWDSHKISRVLRVFETFPDVMGVVHDVRVVDRRLQELAPSYFALRGSGPGLLKNFYKNSYLGMATAFRSTLLPHVLPIPRRVTMHDVWIGLNVEVFGRGYFESEVLASYRRHGANQTDLYHGSAVSIVKKRAIMGWLTLLLVFRRVAHDLRRRRRSLRSARS
ncbi:glycosyltransferase [Terrabacter sp. BE26]|uniref:glycosyltransferase n=1 Tax=Terrabacter sp. BE26 TaxID=2898152 RepID=UPI0035BE7F52